MSDIQAGRGGPGSPRQGHARLLVVGLAILLTVLVTVMVAASLLMSEPSAPPASGSRTAGASVSATPSPAASDAVRAVTSAPPASPASPGLSRPRSIAIPAIAVTSDLVMLALEEDRTVEVPEDADRAGWFELGTSPGQPGSAVILGHVDSVDGPAVFSRLRDLVPGDRVRVTLMDGTVETFAVSRLETVANEEFPAEQVYAGTPDRPTLNIVTCGGDYDAERGGYQSNVIAYTEHVSTEPAG